MNANTIRDRNSAITKAIVRASLVLKQYDSCPTLSGAQIQAIKDITSSSRDKYDIRDPATAVLTDQYLKILGDIYSNKRDVDHGFAVPVGQSTYHVDLKPAVLQIMIRMIEEGISAAERIWPTDNRRSPMSEEDKDVLIRKYLILDDNTLLDCLKGETVEKTRRIAGILEQKGYGQKYKKTIAKYGNSSEAVAAQLININHVDYLSMIALLRIECSNAQIQNAASYALYKITKQTRRICARFKPDYDTICLLFNCVDKVPERTDPRYVPATTMTPKKIERIIFMAASTLMPELRVSSLEMLPLAENLPESVQALQNAARNMSEDDYDILKVASIARALINPFDCVFNFGVRGLLNTVPYRPSADSKGFVYKHSNSQVTFSNVNLDLTRENRDKPIADAEMID